MSDLQPGPCIICGATNYGLSFGGPTICPSCDCGDFGLQKVQRQGKKIGRLTARLEQIGQEMAALMAENARLTARVAELEAALRAIKDDPEAGVNITLIARVAALEALPRLTINAAERAVIAAAKDVKQQRDIAEERGLIGGVPIGNALRQLDAALAYLAAASGEPSSNHDNPSPAEDAK